MDLPVCQYGSKCYRKNPEHFLNFSHPPNTVQQTVAIIVQDKRDDTYQTVTTADIVQTTLQHQPTTHHTTIEQTTIQQTTVQQAAVDLSPSSAPTQQATVTTVQREIITIDSSDSDENDELPPLVPLLRQLSVSAKSGLLGSEEKAHLKDLLLSGNRDLVLSAATILGTLQPQPLPPAAAVAVSPAKEARVGRVMYVVRGISGSGKSFLSQKLTTQADGSRVGTVCSTDDFFLDSRGAYNFDGSRLTEAHSWNQQRVQAALNSGITPVVVDNTHTQCWEAQPYVAMAMRFGYEVRVEEPTTWWAKDANELAKRNQHGVPLEAIQRMLDRWEADFSVQAILAARPPNRGKPQANGNRKKFHKPAHSSKPYSKTPTKTDHERKVQKDDTLHTGERPASLEQELPSSSPRTEASEDDGWQQVSKRSYGKR